ncbi:MAG: polysaccharide biosynthesis tyrosine autokinase [Bacteroidota bacterium]
MENNNTEFSESQPSSPVDDFNLGLLLYVVQKSIVWIIFIVIVCVTLSIIYLRYTPRVYEATTSVMIKHEKTTQILGYESVRLADQEEISRQVQLMKSNLLLDRVMTRLPLQTGYYKEGKTKFIFSELYTSTPFEIEGITVSNTIINVPIYVKIINPHKVYINFTVDGKEFEYTKDTGQVLTNSYFSMAVHVRNNVIKEDLSGIYYFKFLSKKEVIDEIATKLDVAVDFATKTIKISLKDRNPERARAIVSSVADEFIVYAWDDKREGIRNILNFIETQIDTFAVLYDAYQDSIIALRLTEGYNNLGQGFLPDASAYEEKFRGYKHDLTLLYHFKELLLSNKEFANLASLNFKLPTQSFNDEINQIISLQQKRNLLLLDATPQHPSIRLLDKEIDDLKGKLNQDVDNTLVELNTNFTLLRQEYGNYLYEWERIPGLKNKFDRLDKIAAEKNDFILGLYGQLSHYLIGSAGIVSDYVVLEKAALPQTPVSPKEQYVQIIGFVVGLLLGLLLIVVRYLLHNTIISIDEVERKIIVPLLGVIPRHNQEMDRSQIVVIQDPKSTITEAFRAVRNNLQFISNTPGPKIISTTSTIPGEGKTFISLNIAAILSLLNKRVIILDFDMRKPKLSKIFNVIAHKGVSTILSGQTNVDDCVFDSGIPNLSFITSGPLPPNPSELIMLPKLQETLEYLKTKYDYIIIDTPPIGLVTDALEILKLSDYPLYILRASYSNKSFVHGINRIVRESKIKNLSVVINDYGRGASGYGSSYGHNYGYGYAYGYGSEYGEGYYTVNPQKPSWFKKLFN